MDARPYRPRGAENAPVVHNKHKSTSNLAAAAAMPAGGLRGPAKRAAFGDVTNVSKQVGNARDEVKKGKAQISSIISHVPAPLNKENGVHTKDAFSRPAQRPAGLGSKLKIAADNKLPEPIKKPARQNVAASHDAPSQRPRHHKSQPQLANHQQPLRRIQSKQLTRTSQESALREEAKACIDDLLNLDTDNAYVESLRLPEPRDSLPNMNDEAEVVELPMKLPELTEEVQAAVSFQDAPAPIYSELEEVWDDDEDGEEYDDQDQAYTTTHSFRSRDFTTGGATVIVAPHVTARVQRELDDAQFEVEMTRTRDDIEEELWDVSMVAEYGDEIFEYMRDLEIKMLPNPHYMDVQTEIQWSMRSVLMDWLVQVHSRFGLLPETLFLTVNYIDRFLSSKIVSIGKLQLVGATAILVASKYEEINCPSLQEIVYMVDHGYTTEEILKAERFMLSMLSFELGWPGPMSFLRRVSKADDYDLETRTLAKYFLELTIMDERFVASPPSFLAAGAHCLSRLVLEKGEWTKAHVHYSGYTWGQLKSLVSMMLECCEHPRLHHAAIFEKYSDKKFKGASLLVQSVLDLGFTLPHLQAPLRSIMPVAPHSDDTTDDAEYINGQLILSEG